MVLISSDALNMMLAATGAFFSMSHRSYQHGKEEAPTREELLAMQQAIREAATVLGQEAIPRLQEMIHRSI